MLVSMTPEIQKNLEDHIAFEILQELKTMFQHQTEQELTKTVKAFHDCKQEEGQSVSTYVLKMKAYLDQIDHLGYPMPLVLRVNLILTSLSKDHDKFLENYNMHDIGKTIPELHAMLKLAEKGIPKKAPDVLAIRQCQIQKPKLQARGNGKNKGKGKKLKKNKASMSSTTVSKDNVFYFNAIPHDGIFEIDMHNHVSNERSIYTCSNKKSKHNLDSTFLWHCRLGYINKKRTAKLQHDGLLKSINDESFDVCVSCISGKMAIKPFTHASERADDLLGLIHSDVCGSSRTTSREGYLKEMMGYYFYYPPENKSFVARYVEFLENSLISQEASGSTIDFDEIQREDEQPYENTSEHQPEAEHNDVEPQTDVNLVRRSARIPQAPERYGFYVDVEEHKLRDHGEPANYRAVLSDPKFDKWLKAMNVEMQSMKDNQVGNLVDLPPNCKTVGSKWLFKKKTNMDGNIHTYKARLVAKGFTQTYRVDYEETFSPIADIKAIRILIAIAVFYDYEIWQMDVKTTFLNGHLNKDVYMVQPEGFVNPKHPRRVCKLQISIYRLKKASRSWNKRFDEEIKKYGFTQNIDEPCESLWTAVKNILKYLQNTKDMFLVYGGDSTTELSVTCYIDAGWETDRDDLRSQTRFVFVMIGGTVDWKSSKQSTTAMSSLEAEYIAASEAAMEAIWIRKFISGLIVIPSSNQPIDMYCDNIGAITIVDEPIVQWGAKHF
ncbi:retrotransposon protein, putative, ty1-copia subclass [Tanacetum coccineum]